MRTIKLSPIAKSYYGFSETTKESLLNYGYALLTIAGSDQKISPPEWDWFKAYYIDLLQIPAEIAEKYEAFDYQNADIHDYLASVRFATKLSTPMLLLYDSIRMAKADNDYADHEQEVVEIAADLLGVPEHLLKSVEDFVDTENALIVLRKSLFRADESKHLPKGTSATTYNSWTQLNFGYTFTSEAALLALCKLLLSIAGSDGEVSQRELRWLIDIGYCAGVSESILQELPQLYVPGEDISELVNALVSEKEQNLDRLALYLAIHMCNADEDYARAEQEAVHHTANLLHMEQSSVKLIEALVQMEISQGHFRRSILSVEI